MVLPDHECKPAALAALHAVVAEYIHPDDHHDVQVTASAYHQTAVCSS